MVQFMFVFSSTDGPLGRRGSRAALVRPIMARLLRCLRGLSMRSGAVGARPLGRVVRRSSSSRRGPGFNFTDAAARLRRFTTHLLGLLLFRPVCRYSLKFIEALLPPVCSKVPLREKGLDQLDERLCLDRVDVDDNVDVGLHVSTDVANFSDVIDR